jgi:hypothetical protein
MQYEHRRDTKTSIKLVVGVVRLQYAHSLTEMAYLSCEETAQLAMCKGSWRFGRY